MPTTQEINDAMRIVDLWMGKRNIIRRYFLRLIHMRKENSDIMIDVKYQEGSQIILRRIGINCRLDDKGLEREEDDSH
jgi:hypothetical protein